MRREAEESRRELRRRWAVKTCGGACVVVALACTFRLERLERNRPPPIGASDRVVHGQGEGAKPHAEELGHHQVVGDLVPA